MGRGTCLGEMDSLSNRPHFPPPVGPLKGHHTVNPRRKLVPLLVPPTLVPLPSNLPSRSGEFTATHTLSVHIFPAAFPRSPSTPGCIQIPPVEAFKDNAERKKWISDTAQKMVEEKVEADKMFPDPAAGVEVGKEGLWGSVLRIRRTKSVEPWDGRKGVTLVATHAIGFHKEIWEPVFKNLIESTEASSSAIRVEEFWSLEAVNHGDAGLLNGSCIPKLSDRSDYARDLANFLIYYLPEGSRSHGKDISVQLPRISELIAEERIMNGFSDRTLVAIGHSLGGDAVAVCAIGYPRLFSSVILTETTLFPPSSNNAKRKPLLVSGALSRRSSWTSRQEARKSFLNTPLFQAFDPSVLDSYINHGLYEDSKTGQVHLKCYPAWEASEFTERRTMNEGWELLPTLDEKIELRWIMGGKDEASDIVGGPETARITVWRRGKNASNVRIPGGGHLIVQEKPRELAEEIAIFLTHKYGRDENCTTPKF